MVGLTLISTTRPVLDQGQTGAALLLEQSFTFTCVNQSCPIDLCEFGPTAIRTGALQSEVYIVGLEYCWPVLLRKVIKPLFLFSFAQVLLIPFIIFEILAL